MYRCLKTDSQRPLRRETSSNAKLCDAIRNDCYAALQKLTLFQQNDPTTISMTARSPDRQSVLRTGHAFEKGIRDDMSSEKTVDGSV